MCVGGTPDTPSVPERQAAKAPDASAALVNDDARKRRRLLYGASMLTGPQGVTGPAVTTANMKATTGG